MFCVFDLFVFTVANLVPSRYTQFAGFSHFLIVVRSYRFIYVYMQNEFATKLVSVTDLNGHNTAAAGQCAQLCHYRSSSIGGYQHSRASREHPAVPVNTGKYNKSSERGYRVGW